MMGSSSTSTALVAGSLLVAASVGYSYFMSSGSSKSSSRRSGGKNTGSALADIDEIDDDDNRDEFITPEEVRQIFDKLHLEMQNVFAQLMQQVQSIQMAGQNIPERQLRGMVNAEMERALQVKQKAILEQYDMDYDCLEEATWEFLEQEDEYPTVKKSVERFQKLWQTATGAPVSGWRPGKTAEQIMAEVAEAEAADVLSPERTMEAAEVYFGSMTDTMRKLVAEYKANGKNLQNPAVAQELNAKFANQANENGEAALEDSGVTQAQFEASVKAHAENPTVARALGMLQMRQQQELMAMQTM